MWWSEYADGVGDAAVVVKKGVQKKTTSLRVICNSSPKPEHLLSINFEEVVMSI